MMLNIRIFSLEPKAFTEKDFARIYEVVERSKCATLTNISISKVKDIQPIITSTGRIDWGWFAKQFSYTDIYNVVVFHFPRKYRRKWKMNPKIAGTYRNDPDTTLEFWMTSDRGQKAKGYKNKETETCRLFLHELLHGLKRKTGGNSDDVHVYDYVLKDIAIGYFTL